MGDRTRERNNNWRGGRTVDPRGYVLLRRPEHPRADVRGYVYEHIVVAEERIGRPLAPGERVRHRNGNSGDNRPENLSVVALDRQAMVTCACGCGARFTRLDAAGRPRRFVTGHNSIRRTERRPKSETGAGLSEGDKEYLLDLFAGRCAYGCGRIWAEWDHLIPRALGGSFRRPGNAVPSCRSCNAHKADADPGPWIERGALSDQAEAWMDLIALAVSWGDLHAYAY